MPDSHLTMARSNLLVLYRGTFYYGRGGHGLKQIMRIAALGSTMRFLIYALYKVNRQAGERANLGLGFKLTAYYSAKIL